MLFPLLERRSLYRTITRTGPFDAFSAKDRSTADWELPSNGTAPVQYTPGSDGRSRLSGHVNWFGIVFFALFLVVLGVFEYRLWREASEATKLRPSKRRK
jgi:hypothetical protein